IVLLVMAIQMMFVTGVAMILSVLNVYFRDVRHLIAILLSLWFYLTPIVYPITLVPVHSRILGVGVASRTLYSGNPMVGFTQVYRALLYDLRAPSWLQVGYLALVSFVVLLLGQLVFTRLEGRLAEEL